MACAFKRMLAVAMGRITLGRIVRQVRIRHADAKIIPHASAHASASSGRLRRLVSQVRMALPSRALRTWRSYSADSANAHRHIRRALAFLFHDAQARCMHTWQAHAAITSVRHVQAQRVLRAWAQLQLARAMRGWSAGVRSVYLTEAARLRMRGLISRMWRREERAALAKMLMVAMQVCPSPPHKAPQCASPTRLPNAPPSRPSIAACPPLPPSIAARLPLPPSIAALHCRSPLPQPIAAAHCPPLPPSIAAPLCHMAAPIYPSTDHHSPPPTTHAVAQHTLLRGALMRVMRRGEARAFTRWLDAAGLASAELHRARGAVARLWMRGMGRAFNRWVEKTGVRLRHLADLRRAVDVISGRGVSNALMRWVEKTGVRLRHWADLRRAVDVISGRGVSNALMRWRIELARRRLSTLLISRFKMRRGAEAVRTWRDAVRTHLAPGRATRLAGVAMGQYLGMRRGWIALVNFGHATRLALASLTHSPRSPPSPSVQASAADWRRDHTWQEQQSAHTSVLRWTGVRRALRTWRRLCLTAQLNHAAHGCAADHWLDSSLRRALLMWAKSADTGRLADVHAMEMCAIDFWLASACLWPLRRWHYKTIARLETKRVVEVPSSPHHRPSAQQRPEPPLPTSRTPAGRSQRPSRDAANGHGGVLPPSPGRSRVHWSSDARASS